LTVLFVLGVAATNVEAAVAHPEHCDDPPALDPVGSHVLLRSIGTLATPTHVAAPPDDRHRLFVTERTGRVRLIRDGHLLEEPFLDLSPEIAPTIDTDFNERGLFSIAFDPDYAKSRRFYLFFSDADGDTRIQEFLRSSDPNLALKTGRDLFVVEHSFSKQHYGGHLAFGPDNQLYASVGDAGIPALAQRRREPYGKILRLNPRRPSAATRFLATGLRNPYRFSFDRLTGELITTDVGEEGWEEINLLPRRYWGIANFGWPRYEGPHRRTGASRPRNYLPPTLALSHRVAHSIVGGFVVRDPSLEGLHGRYLFADFCDGTISSVQLRPRGTPPRPSGLVVPFPVSFSEGPRGRLYVTSLSGGVYRLVNSPPTAARASVARPG
jgi:glucose/arabinose dehydrogenase